MAARKTKLGAKGSAKSGGSASRVASPPPGKKPKAKAPAHPAARARPSAKPPAVAKPARTAPSQPSVSRPKSGEKRETAFDRLHQVALVATNLDTAVAFYGDVLGLPFIARFDPPGLAFFDLGGGVRLMLSATASAATLYFYVKDIEAAYRTLAKRGVSFLHKPALIHRDDSGHFGKKGGEEWMAFFKDPSENLLALVARR